MSPIIFLAILLLIGLTAVFKRVSSVLFEKYSINIIPSAIVQMIAVITFLLNYGGKNQSNTMFLILSVLYCNTCCNL